METSSVEASPTKSDDLGVLGIQFVHYTYYFSATCRIIQKNYGLNLTDGLCVSRSRYFHTDTSFPLFGSDIA